MSIKENIVFDAALSNRIEYLDGYLRVNNTVLSSGEVNEYYGKHIPEYKENGLLPDKIYNVFRDPVELEKALTNFEGLPLLLDHKQVNAATIDEANKAGAIGTDNRMQGDDLVGTLLVHKKEIIDLIRHPDEDKRVNCLSCSYIYTPVFEKGLYKGKPYDVRMTNIIGEHVALVKKGRVKKAVVADTDIQKKGIIMSYKSWFNLPAKKKTTNDAAVFTPADFMSVVTDIMNGENSKEEKEARVQDLMDRLSGSSVDENLDGNNKTDTVTTDAPDPEEKPEPKKSDKKIDDEPEDGETKGIVDPKMLAELIHREVRKAISELHAQGEAEEEKTTKAMDEALKDFRSFHGEPNIAAFQNKPENVYKEILKQKNVTCDSWDIKELKAGVKALKQTVKTYVTNDSVDNKKISVFDDPKIQAREVR